jgi:ferric-dicitrate binding protein FerR (iron transport regulator)
MTQSQRDELRALLDALCEESITADQVARLEALVLSDPEAEAHYVQYMQLFADLGRRIGGEAGMSLARMQPEPVGAEPSRPLWRRRRLLLWTAVGLSAAAAALLLVVGLGQRPESSPSGGPQEERVDDTVAMLLQASGAVWEKTDLPTRVGVPLRPGRLRLKAGFALLEFYSGATVILEGPAEIELLSRTKAYCAHGKLRVTVPPQAQGFTVGSPQLDVVDRGTEFGLQVGAAGKTEVHVIQGKVELYDAVTNPRATTFKELTTGQAILSEGAGAVRPIELNPATFMSAKELAARALADIQRRQAQWEASSKVVRQDPKLLVYYDFQGKSSWERVLPNHAPRRAGMHDGAIVGCSWVTGRWPGKAALEFKQVSDRVRFHVPGEFESLTLMTWVRVDALANNFNSLMMADGGDHGVPHWHISGGGKLELGVSAAPKPWLHYFCPQPFTPEELGQWTHLAVVYDAEARRVAHYVNGQMVHDEPLQQDLALRIGDAELGNWNMARHRGKSAIRFFSGAMDEFMLFARALSDQEIERIYHDGRPQD